MLTLRKSPVSQKDFFAKLGAPVANSRQGWGSIRPSDGAVFLRVWQDEVQMQDGRRLVQVTHHDPHQMDVKNSGDRERLQHLERVREGAACYLVMCQATDVNAVPRVVKQFNEQEVFLAGGVVDLDRDSWIELGTRVPIRQAIPPKRP
ncbi:MAG: hypothetical protein H0T47_11720 [Planctomycetaceae bacterium]|nr:hypothetical protein [Planctomycetaceae bacterium]